jgi:hypothetical protein
MASRSIHLCGQDVERPGHICAFFTSREQEYETLIPYFRQGLDAGEQVVNVIDAARVNDHRARLAARGVPVDDGRVAVSSSEETYLAGGHFDMTRMVAFVTDAVAAAAIDGRRVRAAGWMDWVHQDAPGTERAMEYEARMNKLVPQCDGTFVCVYDLSRLSGQTVADIMATHPYVILNGRIRENSFYVPPDIYLEELLGRSKTRRVAARASIRREER